MGLQNLVDQMGQTFQESLPSERHGDLNTFVVFNQRRKVPAPGHFPCNSARGFGWDVVEED